MVERVIDFCHPLHTKKEFYDSQSQVQSYTIQYWDLDQKSKGRKELLNCKLHILLSAKVLLECPICHWTSIILWAAGSWNPGRARWILSEDICEGSYICQDAPWYLLSFFPIACPDLVLMIYTTAPISGINLYFLFMKPVHDWMYGLQRKIQHMPFSTSLTHKFYNADIAYSFPTDPWQSSASSFMK